MKACGWKICSALVRRRFTFSGRTIAMMAVFFAVQLQSIAGQVLSATVESNGWVLDVTITGTVTAGAFDYGFTTQSLGGATIVGIPPGKLIVNMNSLGFDDTASATTFPRSVYATRTLRYPYGVNGQTIANYVMDIKTDGTNTVIRSALSDYIYATDSNLTMNVGANWYTGNSGVTGLAVANNSTNLAGRVVGNWSRPPHQRITNSTATVACVAFGHGAQQGRPVRCVQFWATDESSTSSPTNTVVTPTIDRSQGDATSIIEYVGNIDCSTLATSNRLTVHFAAFPWIGDSNSVLNTSDGRYNFPSMEAAPTRLFLDRDNNFPVQIAVVSPQGSDSSGRVVSANGFAASSPPAAFATTGAAALAIANANASQYGSATMHDNGAGVIYLQPGSNYVFGARSTITIRNYPKTWLTVTPFPGVDRSQVIITNRGSSSGNFLSQMTRVYNCSIWCTNQSSTFGNTDFLWFDHCLFASNSTVGSMINTCTNWYVTQCVVQDLPQGLLPTFGNNANLRLIRGNNLSGMTHDWFPSTVIGNSRISGTNGSSRADWTDSTYHESPSFPIIAFNRFYCQNARLGGDIIKAATSPSAMRITNGAAIVQNIIEQVSEDPLAARCMSVGLTGGGDDTNNANNVICWNNTLVGQRVNWLENAGGNPGVVAQRNNASLLNNVFDQLNSKDDLDYTASGVRTGNWPVMFGVGSQANTDLDPALMDGGWHWSWMGMNCYSNHNMQGTGPTSGWATCFNFVDRESGTIQGTNTPPAAGHGDYHLGTNSPLWQLKTQWVLPYDLDGNPRRASDPPGAFAFPSAKVCSIDTPSYTGNNFSVSFLSQPGAIYNLECLADVSANSWQLVNSISGDGSQQTLTDSSPADSQRFYRIRISSP